jgi:solute:Na+ symporter, SSS family
MLGVGLTALMASFMSGMAGNVTAFNTVFTYDIYQSYLHKGAPDSHYLMVGRITTVVGIALSIGTAYLAQHYNNIMDLLQLVFGFVNAPLFATFLLGMFWRRATGHGAFFGLLSGTTAAALTHGLTIAEDKGGWIGVVHTFPSVMAQNFYIAIFAWSTCFLVTVLISVATKPKTDLQLESLVYGLTKIPHEDNVPWYKRPGPLAVVVAVICIGLNFLFWLDMLDLRIPSGSFFLLLGLTLTGLGVFDPGLRAPLLEVNVNLYAGVAMAVFGGVMLWLARKRA